MVIRKLLKYPLVYISFIHGYGIRSCSTKCDYSWRHKRPYGGKYINRRVFFFFSTLPFSLCNWNLDQAAANSSRHWTKSTTEKHIEAINLHPNTGGQFRVTQQLHNPACVLDLHTTHSGRMCKPTEQQIKLLKLFCVTKTLDWIPKMLN